MKILFDNQIFSLQKYGGISRYFSELFKRFNMIDDFKYELPIQDTENEYLKKVLPFSRMYLSRNFTFPNVNSKIRSVLNKLGEILNKNSNTTCAKKSILRKDFDIFHPTYYSTYFLKYLGRRPFVLTVHDMIHEKYPKLFLFDIGRTIRNKRKLILRADKIIAVSENTKKDIINFYNIPPAKIKVVYHGNSLNPVHCKPESIPKIPEKYILFVGSRGLYKNFLYFIESVTPILVEDPNINIVAAGGYSKKNGFSYEEITVFKKLNIINQIFQYSINDEILAYLYQNALCFVFPTLYEGFGIPILEAFACSCPAIISNTSSLPEVGGNAAEYFDPTDKTSILESIRKVIYSNDLRKTMILNGKEQLKKFSWDKTAKETMDVYKSLYKNTQNE